MVINPSKLTVDVTRIRQRVRRLRTTRTVATALASCQVLRAMQAIQFGWTTQKPTRRTKCACRPAFGPGTAVQHEGVHVLTRKRILLASGASAVAVVALVLRGMNTVAMANDTRIVGVAALSGAAAILLTMVFGVIRWVSSRRESPEIEMSTHMGAEPEQDFQPAAQPPVDVEEWLGVTLDRITVDVRIERAVAATSPGGAVVVLGSQDDKFLMMDLAKAPGVIAVGGDSRAAESLLTSMVRQLTMISAQHEILVSVIGPIAREVEQCARLEHLDNLSALTSRPADDAAIRVIVWAAAHTMTASSVEFLVGNCGGGLVVPVVLGEMPDAPWRITVHPASPPVSPTSDFSPVIDVEPLDSQYLHTLEGTLRAQRLPEQAIAMVVTETRGVVDDARVAEGERAAVELSQAMTPALRELIDAGVLDELAADRMDAVTVALCVAHVLRDVSQTIAVKGLESGAATAREYRRFVATLP